MVRFTKGALAVVAALMMSGSAFAEQRVLKYNADFDATPLAGMQALIADFEAANPDIKVELNNFDHEGYKTAIRNFLTADSPDLATGMPATGWRPLSLRASFRMGPTFGMPTIWAMRWGRPKPR